MRKAYSDFLRKQRIESRAISPNSLLLERVFRIPLQGSMLIRSEHFSGGTAVCLELAKTCIDKGMNVVYVDIYDQVLAHRIHDIDKSLLNICRPTEPKQLLDLALQLKNAIPNPIYILDGLKYLKEVKGWDLKVDLNKFAQSLRRIDPTSTVICAQREGRYDPDLWDVVLSLKIAAKDYIENNLVGHYLNVESNGKNALVYVEYKAGRLSEAFEQVTLEIEQGKTTNSVFTSPDGSVTVQGYKNYLHTMNERIFENE